MSDTKEIEFTSLIKWVLVIAAAAFAYNCVSPKYHFIHSKAEIFRANKVNGSVERLHEGEWASVNEEPLERMLRIDRRERANARDESRYNGIYKEMHTDIIKTYEEDDV